MVDPHTYDNVAPFRKKCQDEGVAPDDLRSLEDLRHFPFMVKDDLRAAYPFGLFAVPQSEVIRIHASSGTTGKPTVVGYTRNDIDTWATVCARSLRAGGRNRETRFTTRTATACSPAGWARITARKNWARW